MAERRDTLDLMMRDAPQIERALQDAGLKSDGGLQFSLRDPGGGFAGSGSSHQGAERQAQPAVRTGAESEGDSPASQALPVRASGWRALDVKV